MNKYSISDKNLDLFLFITNEICVIRDSIATYISVGNVSLFDYKKEPEKCVQITLLIDYIKNNITTNKKSITKRIGSIYDLYNSWKNLCEISPIYSKYYNTLTKTNYVNSVINEFQNRSSKVQPIASAPIRLDVEELQNPKNVKHDEKSVQYFRFESISNEYINEICKKYVDSDKISFISDLLKTILLKEKSQINQNFVKNIISQTGNCFPVYIWVKIFHKLYKSDVIKTICNQLGFEKFWSSSRLVQHGQYLGSLTRQRKNARRTYTEVVRYGLLNKSKILLQPKSSSIINKYNSSIEEQKEFSIQEIYDHVYYLYGIRSGIELKFLLKLGIKTFNKILSILELTKHDKKSRKISKFETALTVVEASDELLEDDLTTSVKKLIIIPETGDFQITIKYGTAEHRRYQKYLAATHN